MTIKTVDLSEEALSKQEGNLTDEQRDALREEMRKELYETKPDEDANPDEEGDKTPEKTPEAPKEEETPKDGEKTPEEKAKDDEAAKKAKEEELLKKPDTELSPEEKTQKDGLLKTREEAAINEEAQAFAKEKNVSVEDAKKEIESYRKVAEKYKNNPKEMAKAMLALQREFTTKTEELKKFKEAPKPADLKPGEAIINGKLHTAEEVKALLVAEYRKDFPDVSEDMEDDKVFKLAVNRVRDQQTAMDEANKVKLSADAKDRRSELIRGIGDTEKEYADSIKSMLEKTPDHVLMHPEWSFDTVKSWARGEYFTNEKIQEIRSEAFKKGQEEAVILGEKSRGAGPASSGKPPASKSYGSQLTQDEKDRALDMYRIDGLTDEEKFKSFLELKKHKETKQKG